MDDDCIFRVKCKYTIVICSISWRKGKHIKSIWKMHMLVHTYTHFWKPMHSTFLMDASRQKQRPIVSWLLFKPEQLTKPCNALQTKTQRGWDNFTAWPSSQTGQESHEWNRLWHEGPVHSTTTLLVEIVMWKWIHYIIVVMTSWLISCTVHGTTACHTDALPLELSRKLAVWAATGGWLGIGRWPSAMPTMAVMWVSVPKTWMGMPVVLPEEKTQTFSVSCVNMYETKLHRCVQNEYEPIPKCRDV